MLHSCAAMLKISEMEYSGGNSIFLRYLSFYGVRYYANVESLVSVADPGSVALLTSGSGIWDELPGWYFRELFGLK